MQTNYFNIMDLVYHVFSKEKTSFFKFNRCPVLLSIATYRAFHPSDRVFVIDRTPQNYDWMDYPERLNFKLLKPSDYSCEDLSVSVVATRCADIMKNINQFDDEFFFADADLFWLDSWQPNCSSEKMAIYNEKRKNFQFVNTGLFGINKKKYSFKLFSQWNSLIFEWKRNKNNIFKFLLDYNKDLNVNDESLFAYLINEENNINNISHVSDLALLNQKYVHKDEKVIHLLSNFWIEKIELIFSIKEINYILRKVFNPEDFERFGFNWSFEGNINLKSLNRKILLL